jgi:hypothetical protein
LDFGGLPATDIVIPLDLLPLPPDGVEDCTDEERCAVGDVSIGVDTALPPFPDTLVRGSHEVRRAVVRLPEVREPDWL